MSTVLSITLSTENINGGVASGSVDPGDDQIDIWHVAWSCGHDLDSLRCTGAVQSTYEDPPIVGGIETCPICGM